MNPPTLSADSYDDPDFQTGIGPMTDRIINSALSKLSTMGITDKLLDPVTTVVKEKARPYIYASIVAYLLLIVLLGIIIYLLVKKNKSTF